MRIRKKSADLLKILPLLSILLVSGVYLNFMANISNDGITDQQFDNSVAEDNTDVLAEDENIENLETSLISTIGWWNISYSYRRLINVTNPYSESFTDFVTSIVIDYQDLVGEGKMQADLEDIRIVENGVVTQYYVSKDVPYKNKATIYFKTTIAASTTEYDTFMYYGNSVVGKHPTKYLSQNPAGTIRYEFDYTSDYPSNPWDPGTKVNDTLGQYNATFGTWSTFGSGCWSTDRVQGSHSLYFDGSYDYAVIDSGLRGSSISTIPQLTACLWFKTGQTGGTNVNWAFLDFDRSEYFNFYITGSGTIGFSTTDIDNGLNDFYGASILNLNQWYFAAVVYDGTNKMIYVQDSDPTQLKQDNIVYNPHSGKVLGDGDLIRYGIVGDGSEMDSWDGDPATETNRQWYLGYMDDLRYYKEALTIDQLEYIMNQQELTTKVNSEQSQFARVTVICKDIDGNIVPYANVTLYNQTEKDKGSSISEWYFDDDLTDLNGEVIFSNLDYGNYDFLVKYKIQSTSIEKIMLNASKTKQYTFTGLSYTVILILNMTTINFQFTDWDGNAMNLGYVDVYDDNMKTTKLDTITLDTYGMATFRYRNESDFYYELYYQNTDYNTNPKLLNASTIIRQNYIDNAKLTIFPDVWVNNTNRISPGSNFLVQEFWYSGNDQSQLSWVVNLTISLKNMKQALNYIKVYYVDIDGNAPSSHLIHDETYGLEQSDLIKIDMRNTTETCTELANDHYQAYGIKIELAGYNSSAPCNGTIKVNMTEKWHVSNKTALSRIRINVTDSVNVDPVEGVLIQVNGTSKILADKPTTSLANLTTKNTGFAYGKENTDVEFWYLRGHEYNFTLFFFGTLKQFNCTKSDPSQPHGLGWHTTYSYTLITNASLRFKIQIDMSQYSSNFTKMYEDTTVTHGSIMRFDVNYTITSPEFTGGLTDPDMIKAEVKTLIGYTTVLTNGTMLHLGNGRWQAKFNSGFLTAGNASKQYWVKITGSKTGYLNPDPVYFLVTITAKTTGITIHNQSDITEKYNATNILTVDYNERVNVTVKYYRTDTQAPITGAKLYYSWQPTLTPVEFFADPKNLGYYVFELNTSAVDNIGKYRIEITAYKENFTKITNFGFDIQIEARETILKRVDVSGEVGKMQLYHVAGSLYIGRRYNFSFEYNDTKLDRRMTGVSASYTWYKVNKEGQRIVGFEGQGSLIETVNKTYILNFISDLNVQNSGIKNGSYAIFITFTKANYELRNAFIDLDIKIRPTTINGTNYNANPQTEPLSWEIFVGDSVNFTFEYRSIDPSDGAGKPLLVGNIVKRYFTWSKVGTNDTGSLKLNVTSGKYKLDFNTVNKTAGRYTLVAYIETLNYSLQVYTISLEIKIRTINYTLSGFLDDRITIKQGALFSVSLALRDNSKGGASLIGATVTLTIGGVTLTLTDEDGDGTYTGTFDSGLINTFFQPETLTGKLTVSKKGYQTKEVTVTMVVRMIDTPFLDGVPLFWVVMGIALIGGVAGSLLTYRYIQIARIPKFVKKVKSMRSSINNDKAILETAIYPSKNEFIVKKLGDRWELLGLSLADILGIEVKKAKILPDTGREAGVITKEKTNKEPKVPKEKKEKAPKEKKEKAPKEKKEKPEKTDEPKGVTDQKPEGGAS